MIGVSNGIIYCARCQRSSGYPNNNCICIILDALKALSEKVESLETSILKDKMAPEAEEENGNECL